MRSILHVYTQLPKRVILSEIKSRKSVLKLRSDAGLNVMREIRALPYLPRNGDVYIIFRCKSVAVREILRVKGVFIFQAYFEAKMRAILLH
jgi:hypothetical protein